MGRLALVLMVVLGTACGDDDSGGGDARGQEDGGGKEDGGGMRPDGGNSGTGGMGGSKAGTGGSNTGRPDSGPPDPCADLDDACDDEGLSCDGTDLAECAENEDGCLVETRTDCTDGDNNFCDDSGRTPECAFDPCREVEEPCEEESTSCDGNDLVVCAENEDGCLELTTTDCTDQDGTTNSCEVNDDDEAECVKDPCKDEDGNPKQNVCVEDETMCADDVLVECVDDEDGCAIATQTDCTDTDETCTGGDCNFCNAELDPPACAHDPCLGLANRCLTAGTTCRGRAVVVCAENNPTDKCLVETVTMCGDGLTCDASDGSPDCMTCMHDTACASLTEGAKVCDTNVDALKTCTDTDGDTCLELITQNCGEDFTCDMEDGCVYDGGEECTFEAVLTASGSYGPYMTEGKGNNFNGYQCPGLVFPFAAGASDVLFAIDVAAGNAVKVKLTGETGFTGNGAWMTLLSECQAANAEQGCDALSNTEIGYANDTDATVRVYVSVDADSAGQNMDNIGSFGLTVDVHEIACGDGKLDADEECDDKNIVSNDGCKNDCTLEEGYVCTAGSPSICTTRPEEPICGNVMCTPLPNTFTGQVCCTEKAKCGVAVGLFFGNACLERDQPGVPSDDCPNEASFFNFGQLIPSYTGCCRPDNKCGLRAASGASSGAGCVERTAAWTAMQDGYGVFLYDGPFEEVTCTYEAP